MRIICLLLLLNTFFQDSFCSTILKGNVDSSTKSFNFSLGPVAFVGSANRINSIFVGADEEKSKNKYALSLYFPSVSSFVPLAVSPVTLNGEKDKASPLYGKKIKFVSYAPQLANIMYSAVVDKESIGVSQSERFLVITDTQIVDRTKLENTKVELTQSAIPNDAGDSAAGYVVGLSSGVIFGEGGGSMLFGAVTQNGNNFGVGNSGIVLMRYERVSKDKPYKLNLINPATGKKENKALPFNLSTNALKVGADLQDLSVDVLPVIDMCWDSYLQRLYIAVQVTAAAGADNGARAIVVGRFSGGKLHLDKFIPDKAVTECDNNIIVGAINDRSVSIYKIRVMRTSTGLSYLIVNGGNNGAGTSGIRTVANQVYAIPLVNLQVIQDKDWSPDATQGTAARVDKDPYTWFNRESKRYISRGFIYPAKKTSQLFTQDSQAARVGCGTVPMITTTAPTAARTIKDLRVVGDAVYVSIAADYDVDGNQIQEPGIFHSQAIFGDKGEVVGWSPWKRVGGASDYSYAGSVDGASGNVWYVTGSDGSNINTVKKTKWGTGDEDGLLGGTTSNSSVGLINVLNQQLKQEDGGIQGLSLFDDRNDIQGMPHSGITGLTTLLATGNSKFVFVKTGDNSGGIGTITPYTGNFSSGLVSNSSGKFPSGSGRVFVVSGGDLRKIGPMVTTTTFSNGQRSWIAVGGVKGLAILCGSGGQGYLPTGSPEGMTFKKIGSYSFIQKVVGDGYYLYVLTSKSLDRIRINAQDFTSGNLNRTIIATPEMLGLGKYGNFSDVVICEKMALLATNKGLYRIANGRDVKVGYPGWTYVPVKESTGPMYTLSFVSAPSAQNDGRRNQGQLCALSSYKGYDQARVYRFYVNEGTSLTNVSLQTISDAFVEDIITYYASFGQFRGVYASDGSVRLVTRPTAGNRAMALYALPPALRVGYRMFETKNSQSVLSDLPEKGVIRNVFRYDASGAWLLYGDFGLRVNE